MQLEVGAIIDGKVTGITKFGVFVSIPGGKTGMVHISEVASTFVKEISDFVKDGQEITVKVIGIDPAGKIALSIKRAVEQPSPNAGLPADVCVHKKPETFAPRPKQGEILTFEDMLNKFKHDSDERLLDAKRAVESKRGGSGRRSR
jgi:S1 RNA binding domain protein